MNNYRIEAFGLRKDFQSFSAPAICMRGSGGADLPIALEVSQRPAEECIFIDDRSLNLESPRRLG